VSQITIFAERLLLDVGTADIDLDQIRLVLGNVLGHHNKVFDRASINTSYQWHVNSFQIAPLLFHVLITRCRETNCVHQTRSVAENCRVIVAFFCPRTNWLGGDSSRTRLLHPLENRKARAENACSENGRIVQFNSGQRSGQVNLRLHLLLTIGPLSLKIRLAASKLGL